MLELLDIKWRGGLVGKWNNQRIAGIEVGLKIYFDSWEWIPRSPRYTNAILWLCFRLNVQWMYGNYAPSIKKTEKHKVEDENAEY
jgi:hypothetical protein